MVQYLKMNKCIIEQEKTNYIFIPMYIQAIANQLTIAKPASPRNDKDQPEGSETVSLSDLDSNGLLDSAPAFSAAQPINHFMEIQPNEMYSFKY